MSWHRKQLLVLASQQRSRAHSCPLVPLWAALFVCAGFSFTLQADVVAGAQARAFVTARLSSSG